MITKEQYGQIKLGDKFTSSDDQVWIVVDFCWDWTHTPVIENQQKRIRSCMMPQSLKRWDVFIEKPTVMDLI